MGRIRHTLQRDKLLKQEFDTTKPRNLKENRVSKAEAAKTLIEYIVELNRKTR